MKPAIGVHADVNGVCILVVLHEPSGACDCGRAASFLVNRDGKTRCMSCDSQYVVDRDMPEEPEPPECRGHPAGAFDPMGQTVYCNGDCR